MKSPILGLSGRYKPGDMSRCCAYAWLNSTHPLSWLKAPQWLFAMVKFELTCPLSRSSGFMISAYCLEEPYSFLPKSVGICFRSIGRDFALTKRHLRCRVGSVPPENAESHQTNYVKSEEYNDGILPPMFWHNTSDLVVHNEGITIQQRDRLWQIDRHLVVDVWMTKMAVLRLWAESRKGIGIACSNVIMKACSLQNQQQQQQPEQDVVLGAHPVVATFVIRHKLLHRKSGPRKSAKRGKGCLMIPETRREVQTQPDGPVPTWWPCVSVKQDMYHLSVLDAHRGVQIW